MVIDQNSALRFNERETKHVKNYEKTIEKEW